MLEVFGPDGLIAAAHPEYEYRPGQVEMARAVMRAFEGKRHLIVEAGTGTVKITLVAQDEPKGGQALRSRRIVSRERRLADSQRALKQAQSGGVLGPTPQVACSAG